MTGEKVEKRRDTRRPVVNGRSGMLETWRLKTAEPFDGRPERPPILKSRCVSSSASCGRNLRVLVQSPARLVSAVTTLTRINEQGVDRRIPTPTVRLKINGKSESYEPCGYRPKAGGWNSPKRFTIWETTKHALEREESTIVQYDD